MPGEKNYHTLDMKFNDKISFTHATVDARYARQFQDLKMENGPYQDYRIVDFTDDDRFSAWSRVGVRKGGFNAVTPLYYVRCMDILTVEK